MKDRYTVENLRKLLDKPEYVLWELQRLWYERQWDPVDVMDRDWDNLILLDACRYDLFKQHNWIPGELEEIDSHGGASWEFMQGNFVGEQYHDTVYVTANPHTGKLSDDVFFDIEMLHIEEWDDEYETVLPEDVVEAAIEAHEQYPEKRLIVHFMQPHRPYVGSFGESLQNEHGLRGFNRHLATEGRESDRGSISFSKLVENGTISVDRARRAYQENLDIVLESVEELVELISGKTVVSADHGELIGDTILGLTEPKYGHSYEYIKNRWLYQVPWLKIPAEERRTVTSGEPSSIDRGTDAEVKDRLRSLGYK